MRDAVRLLVIVFVIGSAHAGCLRKESADSVASTGSWARRIADSFIARHPGGATYDSLSPDQKWNYEQGLMLVALHDMYEYSGDRKYFDFILQNLDQYVELNGRIRTYRLADYNLDNIGPGRALLAAYLNTKQEKFLFAADTLRRQIREQPRTKEGGFWHKKIYPFQMWLDGLFMAGPFYAWYAVISDEADAFDDIADQFLWIRNHTRDESTGLFYHAWDESRQQRWADPRTGRSPNFWGRAIGWYAMALVDVLDYFPVNHPRRTELVEILRDLAESLLEFRDEKTGLWYQVLDQGKREGNYLEASASCMFAFSFAKGANKGYLGPKFHTEAARTFDGIVENLVTVDANGFVDLHGTCRSAGLGGAPYRDGSFEYYISEPKRLNDKKGVAPFLRAAIELEKGMK